VRQYVRQLLLGQPAPFYSCDVLEVHQHG
jgi:hypothetical protein